MMLSPPLDNQVIPTKTTNFLSPCNEDVVDERIISFKQPKKEFLRSYSCDVIVRTRTVRTTRTKSLTEGLPKKPHPFRSPITFLRSTTLPRSYKKQISDEHDPNSRLKRLNLTTNDSGWSLDEEYPLCSHTPTATTDNTPFCGLSNQPYYAKRQSASLGKLNKKKGSRSSQNVQQHQQPSFDGHYATMRPNKKEKNEDYEPSEHGSLRRRASSLDFLPEAITKSCNQNGNNGKGTPFGRTTSLSQRSPFRKKISYATATEQEPSLQGIKELRPKGAKRLRSGLDALFDSIEKHDVDELRKVLSTVDVNINELNTDKFTPLDMALMCGEVEIASILLDHGGKENPAFMDPRLREEHLEELIDIADKKVNDYTATIVNSVGDKDNERQLREWEWRLVMLRIMQNKFNITECPKHIPSVTIAPLSNESVVVTITPSPDEFESKNIITKYKVEWSRYEDFSSIEGSKLITDKRHLSSTILGLEKNIGWYFRVQSGNLRGFSLSGFPDPHVVYPSSWHECDKSLPRYYGTGSKLDLLVDELIAFQKDMLDKSTEAQSDDESTSVSPSDNSISPKHRHNKVARGFSKYTNLIFNSAPKLLKKIKRRGIYLAALLYSDDLSHVLVTMDDNLPVVECDDNYSKSFTQEIYWFSKASCTWKDINHMLYFSTKSHSSQSVQIRRKLVQSALALMNATGVYDLGPIHYKPFKDNHGSILLLAVNCIKKNVSWSRSMAMKWIPISKLLKKNNSSNDQVIAPERLIPSVEDQVACHRRSRLKLPRGLYLGYLKLRTSVDMLSIMVPNSHTNIIPYTKIQDIPNVTREEWMWLKNIGKENQLHPDQISLSIKTFEKRLKKSINSLFSQLNIDKESAMAHRIYDREVIELNSEVLFILICPPGDEMCTPPNQPDGFTNLKDYSALPFQAFEMANMMTYQPTIMSSYCRLSSILELENYCMQQVLRQTICHKELEQLKERQAKLAEFQQNVDELWRSSRWFFDTIQSCQDKNLNTGIRLSSLYRTCDWVMVEMDQRLSVNSSLESHCNSDYSEVNVSYESINSCKGGTDHVLVVYGSKDVGLDESSCIRLKTNDVAKTCDLIKMATEQFVKVTKTKSIVVSSSCESSSNNSTSSCSSNSENSNDVTTNSDLAFCEDKLEHLCLVVVNGDEEVCLTDDNLTEHPWNKGKIYLRYKKDSQWMRGVSTTV